MVFLATQLTALGIKRGRSDVNSSLVIFEGSVAGHVRITFFLGAGFQRFCFTLLPPSPWAPLFHFWMLAAFQWVRFLSFFFFLLRYTIFRFKNYIIILERRSSLFIIFFILLKIIFFQKEDIELTS